MSFLLSNINLDSKYNGVIKRILLVIDNAKKITSKSHSPRTIEIAPAQQKEKT